MAQRLRHITLDNRFNHMMTETDQIKLQLAEGVFKNASEGIFITDAKGIIIQVNKMLSHITGYSSDELIGDNPSLFLTEHHAQTFYADIWKVLIEKNQWVGKVRNRLKSGEVYAEMLTVEAVRDNAGRITNCIGHLTNISLINQHRPLDQIAHYDALTDLPNRIHLIDRLQQAVTQSQRRNQPIAVICLDLHGVKAINQQHGFDVGDRTIVALAHRMKEALRDDDTLARVSGGLFVAVLQGLEQMLDWQAVVERLHQAATDYITVKGDFTFKLSASVGVTLYPLDGGDANLLMDHAQHAMNIAKMNGINQLHVFDVAQDCA